MKINVTAATGQLGTKAVHVLLEQGVAADDIVVSVRSPQKADEFAQKGITVRHADYDKPDTLTSAFRDTDILLLIPSSAPVEPRIMQHHYALEAAELAGVNRIVFASFMAATPTSKFLIAPFLLYAESRLRLSGLDWTILRDGMYLDPVADWIPDLIKMGRLPYPVKNGRVAYISRDDIARSLAAAVIETGHSEKLYKLTGTEAISMPELAKIISRVTGKKIVYDHVTEMEFADLCRKDDIPEEAIEVLNSMYRAVDNGEFDQVTDHVKLLTGTPPKTVEHYIGCVIDE
ncbi:SDR family oxidoreductase [Aliifodinibius sp. S!AR15-10]|uniref:SDR family oxidoreductase n=1 Tax=Aliifodinibius sp. S!AR15-10 TaxID=2950437 RepID=UPI0028589AC7|nr:SDR family oxidoreductase [Aliifodinibius sp. S!AR15-10]MDR8392572.1 SDR family oxidoreductase [Aliifodinibius sp. S!AR15-10]